MKNDPVGTEENPYVLTLSHWMCDLIRELTGMEPQEYVQSINHYRVKVIEVAR